MAGTYVSAESEHGECFDSFPGAGQRGELGTGTASSVAFPKQILKTGILPDESQLY